MNAPLPSIFRPPSSERDQTIMRPPGNDDFCLQVPNSSDYLIPLTGPRSAAERLLSEASCVTLSEALTTCSVPIVTSPSAPKHDEESGGCWETSFTMQNSKSDQQLIPNDIQNGIIDGKVDHTGENHPKIPPSVDEEETKLISLDTPQPTPTTIKPPMSFAQLDGFTAAIMLDPSTLVKGRNKPENQQQKMSYANVQVMNSMKNGHNQLLAEKMNGNSNSFDGSSSTISANSAPFTIQGFNDRYINKDNHSEISC